MQHALSFYQCTSHFAFARAVARAVADRQVNALGHLREGGKILKNKETVRVCVCRVTESLLFRTKKHVQLMQPRKRMSADAPCKLSRLLFNSCLPLLSVKLIPLSLSISRFSFTTFAQFECDHRHHHAHSFAPPRADL